MIDEAALNGPDPPRTLDALDVDLWALNHAKWSGPGWPTGGYPVFTWHRPDECLVYCRWADADGERYYTREEFLRRARLEAM